MTSQQLGGLWSSWIKGIRNVLGHVLGGLDADVRAMKETIEGAGWPLDGDLRLCVA